MTTEYRFGPGDDREFLADLFYDCVHRVVTTDEALARYDAREAARPCHDYVPPGTGGAGASRRKDCGGCHG